MQDFAASLITCSLLDRKIGLHMHQYYNIIIPVVSAAVASPCVWTAASLQSGLVCRSFFSIADKPSSSSSFLLSDIYQKRLKLKHRACTNVKHMHKLTRGSDSEVTGVPFKKCFIS